jgi:hypothetical protein
MNLRFLSTLVIALTLTLGACDSDNTDDDNNNPPGAVGTMEALIDGTQWTAANATANSVTAAEITSLFIAGATASADAMTITFVGTVATGQHTLGDGTLVSMSFIDSGEIANTFVGSTGTVNITVITSEKVKGTFSFNGKRASDGESVTVTSGTFDVEYGLNLEI